MRNLNESAKTLRELLAQRILVLDGAMGTMLQQCNLNAEDFGGAALEGCNENLVRTRPDVVLDIHRKYFEAGSDIVETNSFGGAPIVLAEYGLAGDAHLLNKRAAELARQAADEFSTPGKPRFVAGRSEEHTSELQSQSNIVCRLLLEKKKKLRTRNNSAYSYMH